MHDSRPAGKDDEAKIRAAALDYIGGVLEADPARMERCLHPDLAKRAYLPGVDGKPQLSQISALNLIRDARTWEVPACRGRRPRSLRGIGERSNHVRPLD